MLEPIFYLGSHLTGVCSLLQCFLPLRITQMWERHASSPLTGSPLTGSLFQRDLAFLFDILDDGGSLLPVSLNARYALFNSASLSGDSLASFFSSLVSSSLIPASRCASSTSDVASAKSCQSDFTSLGASLAMLFNVLAYVA